MKLFNLFVLLLASEAKRKKRGRVKGGTKVQSASKYPSFVSLAKRWGHHFCGGTILDETTILTAAHCAPTKHPGGHKVIFGTTKRISSANRDALFRSNARTIKSSKDLGAAKATGIWGGMDISIVKLEKPIPLGQNVKKVELGTWDEFINHVLIPKAKCTIMGNGDTDVKRQWSDTMKEAQVLLAVNTPSMTGSEYGLFNADPNYCLMFANSDGALTGSGDSGGPIYCKVNGRQKQFGVLSFGTTTKSTDRKNGFMGFVPVFGPEVNKHLGRWSPRNKPPANFPGFDDFIKSFKTGRTLPAYAKTSGSSSSSSRTSSTGANKSSRYNSGLSSSVPSRATPRYPSQPQQSSNFGRSSSRYGGSSGYSRYSSAQQNQALARRSPSSYGSSRSSYSRSTASQARSGSSAYSRPQPSNPYSSRFAQSRYSRGKQSTQGHQQQRRIYRPGRYRPQG